MEFKTDLNVPLHQDVQDTQSSIVSDIAGGALASVVDAGASIWNSLPFTENVDTADMLGRISNNALQVYMEHPDAVHTASFIGGMFAPMGLAMKGMSAMRAGAKGANWFTKAGREADLAKIDDLFRTAGSGTSEYRAARRAFFAKSAVNQAVDAVAAESALLIGMSAHPYMEDYFEDPIKNFGIGILAGGVLGGGIGHIADRFAVNSLTSSLSVEAFDNTIGKLTAIEPSMTGAVALQRHHLNLKNLDNIIAQGVAVGKNVKEDLTLSMADKLRTQTLLLQEETFKAITSQQMRDMGVTDKQYFLNLIANKPEMFGVDSYAFLAENQVKAYSLMGFVNKNFTKEPVLSKVVQSAKTGTQVTKSGEAAYFPGVNGGAFGPISAAPHYAGAAALFDTPEAAAKALLSKNSIYAPSADNSFDLIGKSSAEAQASYIAWMHQVSTMPEKEFAKAVIGNSDNPAMTAMLHQLRTNPAMAGKKIKIKDKEELYAQFMSQPVHVPQTVTTTVETTTKTEAIDATGKTLSGAESAGAPAIGGKVNSGGKTVQAGHKGQTLAAAMEGVVNDAQMARVDHVNIMTDSSVSSEIKQAVKAWRGGGGVFHLQEGANIDIALQRTYSKIGASGRIATNKAAKEAYETYKAAYHSKASVRLRDFFAKNADADGYIYLYRGTHTRDLAGGGSPVLESMTTNYAKAKQFANSANGQVTLYKIHPNDIVVGFKDIGGGSDNTEIIVRASSRHPEAALDRNGKLLYTNQQIARNAAGNFTPVTNVTTTTTKTTQSILAATQKIQSGIIEVDEAGLVALIKTQKVEDILTNLANGQPLATIALKTNTPEDVVKAFIASGGKTVNDFEDVLFTLKDKIPSMDATTGSAIVDVESATAALSVKNKPLLLRGNPNKKLLTAGHAALDNRALANINSLHIGDILGRSNSVAVKGLGTLLEENATAISMMNAALGKANNEAAGNRFFNSFDHWARNMGDVGPVVSMIGKSIQKLSNDMIGRVAEPIKNAMNAVSKDPAAVIEFNTFKTVNDSLQGWRGVDHKGFLVQQVKKDGPNGSFITLEPVKYMGRPYQIVTPSNIQLIKEIQARSNELRDLHNTIRKIKGVGPIQDIGLWLPAFNPTNKYIAYVHDVSDDTTKLLAGKTAVGLEDQIKAYQKHIDSNGLENVKIIRKGPEQELWSKLNGRMDPVTMTVADVSKLKTGSASPAIVPNGLDVFGEVIGGYEHYITTQMRNLADVSMSDTTFMLDRMSALNKWKDSGQPLTEVKKGTHSAPDAAATVKNTLLGSSSLGEYAVWKWGNQMFETGLVYGQQAFNTAWNGMIAPLSKSFMGGKKVVTDAAMQKMDYEKLVKDLKAKGIPNPWEGMDDAAARALGYSKLEESAETSKRIVYAGNALAAAVALKIGELAQPLVNIMSLPILTHLAAAQRHPEKFLGAIKANGEVMSAQEVILEGARASNSPQFAHFAKSWEEKGYFTPMISEANKTLHLSRALDRGMIPAVEKMLDSRLVEIMSKPADWSEGLSRRITMFGGAMLAKRLYPTLDDAGVTIFARDFMDRAIGNYHAPQRPVLFQGTLGVALGLFQTYSLTLMQSVYRHLELKNYKELGKAALLQSSIFGSGSLPGFTAVSNQIGENFSDDHVDLVTGTYRAAADPLAESILYGLPSQLGVGTHTRGDISVRFPGLTDDNIVALNFAKQAVDAVKNVGRAMGAADATIPQAVGEALSLQSLSRPLARGAELMTGYSKTGKGNTVATPEEVWTFTSAAARILGTRPLEEIKLRDAIHLDSFYGSVDYKNRQEVVDTLQTRIRAGTLTEGSMSEAANKYMDAGGTPAGWRSALNRVMATTDTNGKEALAHKLRPDSPLNAMIDSLDGY